jgi:ribosomal protein S18 acetylase RimI-like enzyme
MVIHPFEQPDRLRMHEQSLALMPGNGHRMSESEVTIRVVQPCDLPALLALFQAHAEYERLPFTHTGQLSRLPALLFGDPPRVQIVVAEVAAQLVGYAAWTTETSTWFAIDYALLDCLYLIPEFRGHGVGALLLTEVQRSARARGIMSMQCQTPPWNEGALRFYRRHGATARDKVRLHFST